ncbi:MAG TPA: ATP-binding protein, partial [Pyrinomonadaceae bacterium]
MMESPALLYSFRARLLLVLAALLVATLGLQFYLNSRAAQRTALTIAQQEQALAAGISLAAQSFPTTKLISDLDRERGFFLRDKYAGRITNVLVVSDTGGVPDRLDEGDLIDDSLDTQFNPKNLEDGAMRKMTVAEARLPRLVNADQAADTQPVAGEPRAFTISAATSQGLNYIIVVLGAAALPEEHSHWEDVEPLLPTFALMLAATLITAMLVWRFTRSITDLSAAAVRVAGGDFNLSVPAANRRDEIGTLVSTFNEMVANLRRTRDLERQLHEAERSAVIGRFASGIAHEIKNPLNYINLTLDHMRVSLAPEDGGKREVFEQLTTQLKAEVARINSRIKSFLSFTRPAKLELIPLALADEVRDALRLVEEQAAESGIEVSYAADDDIPVVNGDREALRSVFTNLLFNGLQAMEGQEGGQLSVALSSEGDRVSVKITDTGQGIEPEDLVKIFEPYFSTKETGTGLGLPIVKKAVEDHGGSIGVESKQGEGTTFIVT